MQVNVVSVSVVMNADRAKGYYISLFWEIASRSVSFGGSNGEMDSERPLCPGLSRP